MSATHEVRINSIGMKLVRIKAGTFSMGSPADEPGRDGDEGPRHSVTLTRDFWIGQYPVTQEQYERIIGSNYSKFRGPQHPAEMVLREEAMAFCQKLSESEGDNYALPTEARWEYACRAGSDDPYFFGKDPELLPQFAWYADNACETTHPVGLKRPNPFGLYDVYGNVWEWCLDLWYEPGYSADNAVDPLGTTGWTHVLRGGCFYSRPQALRSAKRFGYQSQRFHSVGFRVVCEA